MTIDEAIKHAEEVASKECEDWIYCIKCREEHKQLAGWLKELKTYKEKESKTGHWILTIEDWNKWTCSECGFRERTDIHVTLGYRFCPNCGIKMEAVE